MKCSLFFFLALLILTLPAPAQAGWKDLYRGLIPGNGSEQGRTSVPRAASPLSGGNSPFSAGSTYQQREAARRAAAQERRDAYMQRAQARVVAEQEAAQKALEQAAQKAEQKGRAALETAPVSRPLRVVSPGGQVQAGQAPSPGQQKLPSFIAPATEQNSVPRNQAPAWPYRAD